MNACTPEKAAHELLAVLPLLTRIIAAELRQEASEETRNGFDQVAEKAFHSAFGSLITLPKTRAVGTLHRL